MKPLSTRAGLAAAITLAGGAVAAVSLAGCLGRAGFVLELLTHFRVQYSAALALAALALLALRAPRRAAVLTLAFTANAAVVAPLYLAAPREPASSDTPLRAMLLNLQASNTRYADVLSAVRANDPDVLVLLEVTPTWGRELRPLDAQLPHALIEPRRDAFGIAVMSKLPVIGAEVVRLGMRDDVPSIVARYAIGERTLAVVATHPPPPLTSRSSAVRDAQLRAVAELVRALDDAVIVLGDLNVSPWSHAFADLIRRSGLEHASRGRGVHATWPTGSLLLRIPIDHCMHSRDIAVRALRVGDAVGSDHYPLIVDLALSIAGDRDGAAPDPPLTQK